MADNPATTARQGRLPGVGELVHVRSRRWLIEEVDDGGADHAPVAQLAFVEVDEQPNVPVEGIEVADRPTSSALRKEMQRRFNATSENRHG